MLKIAIPTEIFKNVKSFIPNGYTEVDIGRMKRWIKPDVDIPMQRHLTVMGMA